MDIYHQSNPVCEWTARPALLGPSKVFQKLIFKQKTLNLIPSAILKSRTRKHICEGHHLGEMKAIKRQSKSPPSPGRSNQPSALSLLLLSVPLAASFFPGVKPPILITAVQLILLLSSSFHRRVPQGVRGRLKGGSPFATCLRHIIRCGQSTLA